jgi:hypothetical protein
MPVWSSATESAPCRAKGDKRQMYISTLLSSQGHDLLSAIVTNLEFKGETWKRAV